MKENQLKGLNRFNLFMAFLHFLQACIVFFLSSPDKGVVPITINYLQFDQVTRKLFPVTKELFTVNLAWFVVAFFLLSSLAHLFIGTIYTFGYL